MSEHKKKSANRRRLRWICAIFSAALSIGTLIWATTYKIKVIEPERAQGVEPLPYNDATKAAINIRVEHAKDLFQFDLLALGALWALVIAKRDEARIAFGDYPELIMFVSGSLALLLSLLWHEFYLHELGYYLELGAQADFEKQKSIPDVFQLSLNFLFVFQTVFLFIGVGQAVITLVSAHRLKEAHS